MNKKIFFALIVLSCNSLFALSQEEYQSFKQTVNASHKRSYFAPVNFGDVSDLVFEGRFSNHFFINFRRNSKFAADAAINLTLRMLNQESVPIYTPSYNPGINFYHFSKSSGIFDEDIIYALGFYHYSNGQEGPYENEDGTLNYKDGNFSTNYVCLKSFSLQRDPKRHNVKNVFGSELRYYFETDSKVKPDFPIARLDMSFEGIITDWHKDVYEFFGITEEDFNGDDELFTLNRIKINVGILMGYMRRTEHLEDKIILETIYSFKPFWLDDFSFFAKYYYGKDYYNIHFNDKISQLTIGIMSDNFTFRSDK